MDPSKRKSVKASQQKHCKTWWLIDWLRSGQHTRQEARFGQDAQAALDASETPVAAPSARGTLYRAGLSLAELKPGECGTIRRLFGSVQGRLRLLEMGLTPGTHVKVVRAAAFGGPLDVLVRGYQLSLRREEAAGVWLDDDENELAARQAAEKDSKK
jgi:Fe2+ transport system protein FeoA